MQVRAYKSALGMLDSAAKRDFVAGMMVVKAYQAGIIRELLFSERASINAFGVISVNVVESFANLNSRLAGLGATNGIVNDIHQAFLVPTSGPGALKSESLDPFCNSLADIVLTNTPV